MSAAQLFTFTDVQLLIFFYIGLTTTVPLRGSTAQIHVCLWVGRTESQDTAMRAQGRCGPAWSLALLWHSVTHRSSVHSAPHGGLARQRLGHGPRAVRNGTQGHRAAPVRQQALQQGVPVGQE